MAGTFGALLDRRAAALVGRDGERTALLALLEEGGPLAGFVTGVAGVGKTALVKAFAVDARARGAAVVMLDGRSIEPTRQGFEGELLRALGVGPPAPSTSTEALGALGPRVVILVDTLELLRLVGAELGEQLLDVGARQLVLDGERVDLTRLECDVLDYLRRREGQVRRHDLQRDVWGL